MIGTTEPANTGNMLSRATVKPAARNLGRNWLLTCQRWSKNQPRGGVKVGWLTGAGDARIGQGGRVVVPPCRSCRSLPRRAVAPRLPDEYFPLGGTLSTAPSWRHRFKPDGERAAMPDFQPRADGAPSGEADGPEVPPPSPSAETAAPELTQPEPGTGTGPMPHPRRDVTAPRRRRPAAGLHHPACRPTHVARKARPSAITLTSTIARTSTIDGRTTRQPGCTVAHRLRLKSGDSFDRA